MFKLAMELPTRRLAAWSPLADLDFILAHKVLEDKDYAEFFFNRPSDRELILDNSYHELGYSLTVSELREAARLVRATFVISPDKVGDIEHNIAMFRAAREGMPGQALAIVMTGSEGGDWKEREQFLRRVATAEMLCCTFKQPQRFKWFEQSPMAQTWQRVHLLGVSELDELEEWVFLAKDPEFNLHGVPKSWSVDTGKALKWALKGKLLTELKSLRTNAETTTKGLPSAVSQKILDLTEEELSAFWTNEGGVLTVNDIFRLNVEELKRHCA